MTAPAPKNPTDNDTQAGVLASASALAIAAGAFLDVTRMAYPGGSAGAFTSVRLWSEASGDDSGVQSRMLTSGLPMSLSAVLALGLGLVLVSHRVSVTPRVRGMAGIAAGMVAATTFDELLSSVDTARLGDGATVGFGPAFWLFAAAMLMAATAVGVLVLTRTEAQQQAAVPAQPHALTTADSGSRSPREETGRPLSESAG